MNIMLSFSCNSYFVSKFLFFRKVGDNSKGFENITGQCEEKKKKDSIEIQGGAIVGQI